MQCLFTCEILLRGACTGIGKYLELRYQAGNCPLASARTLEYADTVVFLSAVFIETEVLDYVMRILWQHAESGPLAREYL